MALTRFSKIGISVVVAAAVIGGGIWWKNKPKSVDTAVVAGKVSVPDAPEASLAGSAATMLAFPSKEETSKGSLKIKVQVMEWQSQNSFNYANGGPRTTVGSLFEKAGLNVEIVRQDDCSKSCQDMVKWISDYKADPTIGGFMIVFMGSGCPAYITGISKAVSNLGPQFQPKIFLSTGKSYGEDKVIVEDPAILKNPQLLRGKVIHGVKLDGDMDLLLKFCGDNGIPINTDPGLYDYDACNLSPANDYLQAVVDYNGKQTEHRQIVKNGKTTSKDTTVSFDGVATWTPGDVNAINGRGGVTLISTRTYGSVMPNMVITCKKFLQDNSDAVEKMIVALGQAGDQIRTFDAAKKYACGLTPVIYADDQAKVSINGKSYSGGDYWYQMYNGIKYNPNVTLGGSMVFNLADMSKQFGLNGSLDVYKEIYNTFGTLQSKLYPKEEVFLNPKDKTPGYFLPYSEAVDKQYVLGAQANNEGGGEAAQTDYAANITETVASKSVQINFQTGSAVISPSSYTVLDGVYSEAVTAGTLKLGIYGYTDNTGDPDKNLVLSKQRAEAVRQYLINTKKLPANAVESDGYGDANPVGDNNTAAGKAKNRRVQIVLGQ